MPKRGDRLCKEAEAHNLRDLLLMRYLICTRGVLLSYNVCKLYFALYAHEIFFTIYHVLKGGHEMLN